MEKFTIDGYRPKDQQNKKQDSVSHLFQQDDFSYLRLKVDHEARPLWISPRNAKIVFVRVLYARVSASYRSVLQGRLGVGSDSMAGGRQASYLNTFMLFQPTDYMSVDPPFGAMVSR